ncbi:MAG: hypothetical protein LW832_08280 [Parachlamydia sp.]|nr:hypothetical protein [Parachlamydia sp.]
MNWENCPYAIVTALGELLPQLLNINCYDTFILGDLKLNANTYLFAPDDVAIRIESQATVIAYDPQLTTLRQAIDAFILEKGGWQINMENHEEEDELQPAFINGCNVNVPEFFHFLKEGRPWVSAGLRFDPLEGENYRLSQIEIPFIFLVSQLLSEHHQNDIERGTNEKLENILHEIKENFEVWSFSLNGFDWCFESQQAYEELDAKVMQCINLIVQELHLREFYGKTFMHAPQTTLIKCADLLGKPQLLCDFLEENIDTLLDYKSVADTPFPIFSKRL